MVGTITINGVECVEVKIKVSKYVSGILNVPLEMDPVQLKSLTAMAAHFFRMSAIGDDTPREESFEIPKRKYVRKAGGPRDNTTRRWSTEQVRELKGYLSEGELSIRQIAEEMELPKFSISNKMNRLGLKLKKTVRIKRKKRKPKTNPIFSTEEKKKIIEEYDKLDTTKERLVLCKKYGIKDKGRLQRDMYYWRKIVERERGR